MTIEINHLTKMYRGGVRALDELTLVIPPGMFGLLGPNGAGKTTLMRILAGILHPTNGTVQIDQYNCESSPGRTAIRQILGYLPQELGMYPDLSAYEFLDYVGLLKGLKDRKPRRLRVEQLLETVALSDAARRKVKTFSGGMKRRLGIAQALINDPQVLIVDEPTAGLDPEERIRFRNLLSNLGSNRTVLLSTHLVEDIAQSCQHLALLKNGKLLFQGTATHMIEQTRGKVWSITNAGTKPEGNVTVVSSLNLGSSVQYRVVGLPSIQAGMSPVEPSLEDSYVWFMRTQGGLLPQDSPMSRAD